MDDAFLQDLVAEVAQFLCTLSKQATVGDPKGLHIELAHESNSIHGSLELIWDISLSTSDAETMGNLGCIELLWGVAFQSDDDRIQELCLGAMANMCLQSTCCCRLLALPGAATACMALCAPTAGLDADSGSYVQALRLGHAIIGERASAPQQQALLQPFFDLKVCHQITELFPQGHLQSDSELQAALVDLLVFFLESAAESDLFAQISDCFILAGVFAAASMATQGAFSDMLRLSRLLSSCQDHAGTIDLYGQCEAGCIASACAALLMHPSMSCCCVAMVRRWHDAS
jgi:hypothetical protein